MCVAAEQGQFCMCYVHHICAGQSMGENFLKTWLLGAPPPTWEEGLLWLAWWSRTSPRAQVTAQAAELMLSLTLNTALEKMPSPLSQTDAITLQNKAKRGGKISKKQAESRLN